jgi:hypothetical protein
MMRRYREGAKRNMDMSFFFTPPPLAMHNFNLLFMVCWNIVQRSSHDPHRPPPCPPHDHHQFITFHISAILMLIHPVGGARHERLPCHLGPRALPYPLWSPLHCIQLAVVTSHRCILLLFPQLQPSASRGPSSGVTLCDGDCLCVRLGAAGSSGLVAITGVCGFDCLGCRGGHVRPLQSVIRFGAILISPHCLPSIQSADKVNQIKSKYIII